MTLDHAPIKSAIIVAAILAAGGAAFYWYSIRPTQLRTSCQREVDHELESTLWAEGFFKDDRGHWVHGVTDYTWTGPTDPLPGSAVQRRLAGIVDPALDCIFGGSTDPLCKADRYRKPIDPLRLKAEEKSAADLYTPCLRRHGLRS